MSEEEPRKRGRKKGSGPTPGSFVKGDPRLEELRKRRELAQEAEARLVKETDVHCPEYLAAMRHVVRNSSVHDVTPLLRTLRAWVERDVKGFMAELSRQEAVYLDSQKTGEGGSGDEGEARAADLEARFEAAMKAEGFDG